MHTFVPSSSYIHSSMPRAVVWRSRHTLGRNAAERTCSEPVPHRFINGESDRPREGCERCYFGRMSKATSDRRSNYRVRSRDLFRTKAYVAAIFCSVRLCIKQLSVPLDSLSAIICSVSLFQVARFVFFDSTQLSTISLDRTEREYSILGSEIFRRPALQADLFLEKRNGCSRHVERDGHPGVVRRQEPHRPG